MFDRASLQSEVNETASLPHEVRLLSPYAFELRPQGFKPGTPNYKVLVERAAYRMRAQIVPDYLAVSIVAAVVAGATNNPEGTHALARSLTALGWQVELDLAPPSFRLEAGRADIVHEDEEVVARTSVAAGLLLSEYVLAQLIVTRPFGEMRPAVERASMSESPNEVWSYDPSERDRQTQVHRSLENWLIAQLRDRSVHPMDPAGEPYFDLAWRLGDHLWVCEVKSSSNSENHQLRLGLGQVLQYRFLLARGGRQQVSACLLIESEPADLRWLELSRSMGVLLFWPDQWDQVADTLCSAEGL